MKIATWNVNSVNARLETVLRWFEEAKPDVAVLQEIKCVDEKFPTEAFERLGYNVAVHGQKTYNGVAMLSKTPLEDVRRGLPGDVSDEQARYIEAVVSGPQPVRVIGIYLPNGNPVASEKFAYKLSWMARLHTHAQGLLALEEPFAILGDYNIAPEDRDVHDPELWAGQIHCSDLEREALRELCGLGLVDAFRLFEQPEKQYSWWDYRQMAFRRNRGLRIDHILLSQALARQCEACVIDREPRKWEQPSDHTPVIATIA